MDTLSTTANTTIGTLNRLTITTPSTPGVLGRVPEISCSYRNTFDGGNAVKSQSTRVKFCQGGKARFDNSLFVERFSFRDNSARSIPAVGWKIAAVGCATAD